MNRILASVLLWAAAASCAPQNRGADELGRDDEPIEVISRTGLKICEKDDVASIQVDPSIAQDLLPPGLTTYTDEGGRGVVTFLAQEHCSRVEGANEATNADFGLVWLRVDGPEEVDPVEGATRTLPTFYWYVLEAFSNDPSGTINEPVPAVPVGFNHVLYTETDPAAAIRSRRAGRPYGLPVYKKRIRGLGTLRGFGSAGTLTAHPETLIGRIFGTDHRASLTGIHPLTRADFTGGLPSGL